MVCNTAYDNTPVYIFPGLYIEGKPLGDEGEVGQVQFPFVDETGCLDLIELSHLVIVMVTPWSLGMHSVT